MDTIGKVVEKKCASCLFCQKNEGGQTECRHKSPIAITIQRPGALSGQTEMQIITIWPPVSLELWCGDWQPTTGFH